MVTNTAENETTILGEFLRNTRRAHGLEVSDIADATKISRKNLNAIENSDFQALPSAAFTRGFYRLYAATLSLDPMEIVQWYEAEVGMQTGSEAFLKTSFIQLDEDVSSMAERPSLVTFSSFGLSLLVLLTFGGFLCWYFSWNPATFLSQKLRSLQNNNQYIEQVQLDREISTDLYRLLGLYPPRTAMASVPKQVENEPQNNRLTIHFVTAPSKREE